MINKTKKRNTWETVFYDFLKWPSVGREFIDFMLEFAFNFNVELGLTFRYREPRSYWVEHNRRCLCFLLYLFVYYFQLIFFIKKKGFVCGLWSTSAFSRLYRDCWIYWGRKPWTDIMNRQIRTCLETVKL